MFTRGAQYPIDIELITFTGTLSFTNFTSRLDDSMLGRNTFGCEGGGALVPTRGDSPSPRPFFHHVRGDLYIKALFWVAKASETTISLTYPVPYLTDKQLAYRNNTLFRINMRSLVSPSQKYIYKYTYTHIIVTHTSFYKTDLARFFLLRTRFSEFSRHSSDFHFSLDDFGAGSGGHFPRLVQRTEGGQTIVEAAA